MATRRTPVLVSLVLFALLTVLLSISLLVSSSSLPTTAQAAPPASAVYQSSQTAFGPLTNGGNCSSSNNNQLPSRQLADTLDDAWFTSTGYDTVSLGLFPPSSEGSISPAGSEFLLPLPLTGVTVGISYFNMPNGTGTAADAPFDTDLRASTANSSWGSPADSGDPTLLYNTQEAMQDCSVKPLSLVSPSEGGTFTGDPDGVLYWNAVAFGGTNERISSDSVMFRFSEPVDNFGAWFGDLESRDDGEGELAYIKLYDAAGNVLSVEPVIPNVVRPIDVPGVSDVNGPGSPGFDDEGFGCGDQHQNNGADPAPNDVGDYSACGNHGTRFLGFTRTSADVTFFQVIVGDDDHSVEVPTAHDSSSEHLSFIGPQMAINFPELTIAKVVVNDNFGSSVAGDFLFDLTEDPNGTPTVTQHADGDVIKLATGVEYSIAEVADSGYDLASLSCVDDDDATATFDASSFTMPTNGTGLTCTFTNNDVDTTPASVTVTKTVVNDDTGTSGPGDFSLQVTRGGVTTAVTSGQVLALPNDEEVEVSEAAAPGYTQTSLVCVDASGTDVGNPFVPVADEAYRCTIVNDDDTPPPTTAPPATTVPPTTVPPTTVPPTTTPPTTSPPTTVPPSLPAPTTSPPTTAPPETVPATSTPPTTAPDTTIPPTTPPAASTTEAPVATTTAPGSGDDELDGGGPGLTVTGANSLTLASIALALLAAGFGLVNVAGQRRERDDR